MKKNNIFKLLIAAVTPMLFCMCTDLKFGPEFLDKAPDGDMDREKAFSNRVNAEKVVTNAYIGLPFGIPYGWAGWQDRMGMDILESITDLCQSYMGWGNEADKNYYNGQYDPSGTLFRSKYSYKEEHCWESVRNAYIVIENIDNVPDMSPELKERRKAEMKMVIAVHYCDMFRHYGGIPVLPGAIYAGDEYKFPRETVENTVKFITRMCDEAAAVLPWTVPAQEDGRFTAAAALATKVRVLLFAASPVFNSDQPYLEGEASEKKMMWYGNYDKNRWVDVVKACEEFFDRNEMAGNPYHLVQTGNYRQDYQDSWFKRGNPELLVSTRIGRYSVPGYPTEEIYFYASSGQYGCSCATLNYLEMFPKADGTAAPIDWSNPPSYVWDSNPGKNPANPFANRDPRMYENLVVLGDTWQNRLIETWSGGRDQLALGTGITTGTKMRKFLRDHDNATLKGAPLHWPWLRLAEVYLSYAEALNEADMSGKYGDKYDNIQRTRSRVGIPSMARTLDKEAFRKAVLLERTLEFGWEEVRWFDLVRWKMQDEFTKPLYMLKIKKDKDTNKITFTREQIKPRYWVNNFSPKWYFSAFPTVEVQKGIVQNPGW